MSGDEFSDILGFPKGLERNVCLQLRDAAASQCRVDKDFLTPYADMELLNSQTSAGWDNETCLMDLERGFNVSLTGISLPNFTLQRLFFLFKKDKPANFGEWVKAAVRTITPVVAGQIETQLRQ